MRLPRPRINNCCIHVTHRCHKREFLLGYDLDRRLYRNRLSQAVKLFPAVRLLNYVITSNHVHFLMYVPRMSDLSQFMKWLQGTAAGDINRRQKREGAFWKGRFHATLVETGSHLSRCLFYLDMNMVRARAVPHPGEWIFGGAQELLGQRKRYRIIDQECLLKLLAVPDTAKFRQWYCQTLDELCRRDGELPRESFWSSSLAVGSRQWIEELVGFDLEARRSVVPVAPDEGESICKLEVSQSVYRRLLKRWHSIA